MEDNDEVVYNDINQREWAQRHVLQHNWSHDDTPVYLVEMPNSRPDVEAPPPTQDTPRRRSRGMSIVGGDTYELPESVDNALEAYVRKNITGFRKSLGPEDLDVESKRRSLKYLERGGEVLISPESLQDKETRNEEEGTKKNQTAVKRTVPSININENATNETSDQKKFVVPKQASRRQPLSKNHRKRSSGRETVSSNVESNGLATVLPVALATGPKGSPFDDMGKEKKSRMKIMLVVESVEDLYRKDGTDRSGRKYSNDRRSVPGRQASEVRRTPKEGKVRGSTEGEETLRPRKKSQEDNTRKTKRNSKPDSDENKGNSKRTGRRGTKSKDVTSGEYSVEENIYEKPERPTVIKSQSAEHSRSDKDKGFKRVVSFNDETSEHQINPYKSDAPKIYRVQDSIRNPYSQAKTSDGNRKPTGRRSNKKEATTSKNDKGKTTKTNKGGEKISGGDGEKPTGPVYAKAPKSKKEMYSMKRYHIQIPESDREVTPFCVRFNLTDENSVDMTYNGPVKITHYYSTNKYI